jgi:gamma-glutamyltranspeptidase/glutathione hydrolase
MGGPIQPPGHVQTVVRMTDYAMNPQAALDAPRWKVNAGRSIDLEATASPELREGLIALGHRSNPCRTRTWTSARGRSS